MAVIKKKKAVDVIHKYVCHKYVCDKCGNVDEVGCQNFNVNYRCGYGTNLDMTGVSFCLCDTCLVNMALENIPGAKYESSSGVEISPDKVKELLNYES